ncbi:MAG: hypothetical protein QOI94_2114 [Acidobacteriaceae bacterium]|nr:hypothetical protein [Acidobacteriaceae bacterium]
MHLNVDTSWFVRYRNTTNPDLGATLPQAVTLNGVTAIPRTNADFNGTTNGNFPGNDHIQAIANVAAFHFGMIEQGGTSLYAAMSQKVSDPEVLQITLGIGGDEIAHFLEWVDFAGNGVQQPVAPFTDTISGLTFRDFFNNPPLHPADLVQPDLFPGYRRMVPLTVVAASSPQRWAAAKTLCIGCGKRAGLKPHRLERYLASGDPDFEAKAVTLSGSSQPFILRLSLPIESELFNVGERSIRSFARALPNRDITVPIGHFRMLAIS